MLSCPFLACREGRAGWEMAASQEGMMSYDGLLESPVAPATQPGTVLVLMASCVRPQSLEATIDESGKANSTAECAFSMPKSNVLSIKHN